MEDLVLPSSKLVNDYYNLGQCLEWNVLLTTGEGMPLCGTIVLLSCKSPLVVLKEN